MPHSLMVKRNTAETYPCMRDKHVDKGRYDGSRITKKSGDDIFIASMEKEKRLTSESSTSNHSVIIIKACPSKVQPDAAHAATKKDFVFDKDEYRCAGCRKVYPDAKELSKHSCTVFINDLKFTCHNCDKDFRENANLFSHLRWCNKKHEK